MCCVYSLIMNSLYRNILHALVKHMSLCAFDMQKRQLTYLETEQADMLNMIRV